MCRIVEAAEEWACEMQNHLRLILRPQRSLWEVGVFPLHNPEAEETSMTSAAAADAFLLLGRLFEAEAAAAAFRWLMFVRRYWRPLPRRLLYYYLPP